jgi:large subunit ribosomal protein L14e
MIEPGRVCVKIAGREAGQKCVVIEVLDDNFVLVAGPKVRKRRCNIDHLEPTPLKIELKDTSPEGIRKAFEEAKIT